MKKLEHFAKAAMQEGPWYRDRQHILEQVEDKSLSMSQEDYDFIAAASPKVILKMIEVIEAAEKLTDHDCDHGGACGLLDQKSTNLCLSLTKLYGAE